MNSKKTFLIILIVFVFFLGGASVLYKQLGQKLTPEKMAVRESQQTDQVDEREADQEKVLAPDFVIYDIDGNEIHLSDYIGKPVVLNFWASWCGPCQMEMPDFQKKYLESGEEVQFLMVNMTDGSRETVENASDFIKNQEYTFPVFYDTASNAATTYGVRSLPTTCFIDAKGYLIAQATGAIDSETLQQGIDMITLYTESF